MRYIAILITALVLAACGATSNSMNTNSVAPSDKQVDAVVVDENANEAETNNEANNEVVEENEAAKDKETLAQEIKESVENEDTTVISDDYKQLEEFDAINDTIDLEHATLDIVEDNYGKRVLLVTNDKGIETHKAIYIKNKNRLKIIEFGKGQIFNQVI